MRNKTGIFAVLGTVAICLTAIGNTAYSAETPEISQAQRMRVFEPEADVQMVEPKNEEGTPQGQGTVSPPVHSTKAQQTAAVKAPTQETTAVNPPAQQTASVKAPMQETTAVNPPTQQTAAVKTPTQETAATTVTIPEQQKTPAAAAPDTPTTPTTPTTSTAQETSSANESRQEIPVIDANPLGKRENFLSALPGMDGSGPGAGNTPAFTSIPVTAGSGNTLADAAMQDGVIAGSGRVAAYGPGGDLDDSSVSAQRMEIVEYAQQFLGNPYVYGGSSLTQGADCSGFVLRIFEHFGVTVPRNSREQAAQGHQIAVEAVQPGDLLFYASGNYINHVGIYIGGGQIIHAANASMGITISPSNYRTPCMAVSYLD